MQRQTELVVHLPDPVALGIVAEYVGQPAAQPKPVTAEHHPVPGVTDVRLDRLDADRLPLR
ncbi:hypothetical protein [Kribbella flavida]|uniref:hypothetical protein n=1 Tax=Kribbella flavida TaxID=182640 RepID=UPI001ED90F56|nr:hypothetical protein [Kribbella flavida]